MKMNFKFLSVAILFSNLAACVTPIADFPLVSMSTTSVAPGQKLVSLGKVEAEYCAGDPSNTKNGDAVGYMDEVITIAQKKKPGARFIQDAHFGVKWRCIVLQGTAVK